MMDDENQAIARIDLCNALLSVCRIIHEREMTIADLEAAIGNGFDDVRYLEICLFMVSKAAERVESGHRLAGAGS